MSLPGVEPAGGSADSTRGLVRAAAAVASTRIVLLVLGTAASVLVARSLGPEGRGQYAFVVAVALVAISLAHASVEQAQVYLASTGVVVRQMAANALALALALGILAVALVGLSCLLLGYPSDALGDDLPLLLALAGVPVSLAVLYSNGLLVLSGRTDALNRAGLLAGVVQCALLAAAAATGQLTVPLVVAIWLLNAALPLTVALPVLRPRRGDLSRALAKRQLSTGLRYHGGFASLYLLLRVDILLLAALTDDRAVGLYALAVGLVELTNVATDAVATVVLRRQVAVSLESSARLTAMVAGVTAVLALLVALALVAVSPLLVPWVYGSDFRGAVPALVALAPGVVALAATRVVGGYLLRLNRPWVMTALAAGAMAVNVLANLVLIPSLGIVGAGLASTLAYLLLATAYVVWLSRAAGLRVAAFRPPLLRLLKAARSEPVDVPGARANDVAGVEHER